MKNKIKVLEDMDKVVHKWKFLSMVERSHELDWRVGKYEMCVRNNVEKIVACLPITKDWKIILIDEFRVPVNESTLWAPAWLADKIWEKLEDVVSREVLEETWYIAWKIEHCFRTPTSDWLTNEVIDCYIATDCVKSPDWQSLEWPEQIDVLEVPEGEIDDFLFKQMASWRLIWTRMLGLIYYYQNMKNNS